MPAAIHIAAYLPDLL